MTDDPGFGVVPPDDGDPVDAIPLVPEGDDDDDIAPVVPEDAIAYDDDDPHDVTEDAP